jgi:hypothetical protein
VLSLRNFELEPERPPRVRVTRSLEPTSEVALFEQFDRVASNLLPR